MKALKIGLCVSVLLITVQHHGECRDYTVGIVAKAPFPRQIFSEAWLMSKFIPQDRMNLCLYKYDGESSKTIVSKKFPPGKYAFEDHWYSAWATTCEFLKKERLLDGGRHVFLYTTDKCDKPAKVADTAYWDKDHRLLHQVVWKGELPKDDPMKMDLCLGTAITALQLYAYHKLSEPAVSPYHEIFTGDLVIVPKEGTQFILRNSVVHKLSVSIDQSGGLKVGRAQFSRTIWRIPRAFVQGPVRNHYDADRVKRALEVLGWTIKVGEGGNSASISTTDGKEMSCVPIVDGQILIPLRLAIQNLVEGSKVESENGQDGVVINGQRNKNGAIYREISAGEDLRVYYMWGYKTGSGGEALSQNGSFITVVALRTIEQEKKPEENR